MTYSEIITKSLDNIHTKLSSYNNDNTKDHYKCDYIELLALLNTDELYKDDFLKRFFYEYEDRHEHAEEEQSEISEQQDREVNDLFTILKYRQTLYGEYYPFIVNEESILLKPSLDDMQTLYIVLLSCANLTSFEKDLQYRLADEFEHITYCAMKHYLPNSFEVKKLGSGSHYSGNTRNKLKELGNDLNVPVDNDQIDGIALRANKEKGVDLIAWYKFIDGLPNTIIFLIQCACGKDTVHKQYEPAAYYTYFNFLKYQKEPIITLATPKSVVIKEMHIQQISEVAMKDILYFDRLRIMELILDFNCISSLGSFNLAKELIDKRISVLD
ncbi:MAG: hypothetical protein U9N52_07835 [Campylobacterota bacterium]|nr:hypothetical protein [Campylobacterota bacterium]